MPSAPVVIFVTSNGVGMGHLSRQLATIISAGEKIKPVLFSLSGALPRVISAIESGEIPELGQPIRYEYCPSREAVLLPSRGWRLRLRQSYRSYRWHPYLRDRLVALAIEVNARAIVFDGVVPYAGLLAAKKRLPGIRFIWMRRGMWQEDTPKRRLDLSKNFDLTLEPGDFAFKHDQGPTNHRNDAYRISPVSLTNVLKMSTKSEARAALGLPMKGPVLLLAPGSGALGSVDATIDAIREIMRRSHPHWTIALTRQAIARHEAIEAENLFILDDVYPLARHLRAFDAAASAAGYNAVHELLSAQIPTLLIPSRNHKTDDQLARGEGVAALGAAILGAESLESEMKVLLSPNTRERLQKTSSDLPHASGDAEAARLITEQALQGTDLKVTRNFKTPPRPLIDARASIKNGEIADIIFTETMPYDSLRMAIPVEHLILSASPDYQKKRCAIVDWLYRRDS